MFETPLLSKNPSGEIGNTFLLSVDAEPSLLSYRADDVGIKISKKICETMNSKSKLKQNFCLFLQRKRE